jgi:hypothetical protein
VVRRELASEITPAARQADDSGSLAVSRNGVHQKQKLLTQLSKTKSDVNFDRFMGWFSFDESSELVSFTACHS